MSSIKSAVLSGPRAHPPAFLRRPSRRGSRLMVRLGADCVKRPLPPLLDADVAVTVDSMLPLLSSRTRGGRRVGVPLREPVLAER